MPELNMKSKLINTLMGLDLHVDYASIDTNPLVEDIQGWGHEDQIFNYVMTHYHPQVILEIGTWKGASAINMANIQKQLGISGLILCIDTWLGSNESLWRVAENRKSLMLKDGIPTMFRQFVKNIVSSGNSDVIRHLPMTSTAAAELLHLYEIVADAIYIDAGHQESEVYADIQAFWPILKRGGVLFGDDYSASWPGTVKAVNRFVAETGLKLMGTEWKWLVVKPL